jgi:hypothetical protein
MPFKHYPIKTFSHYTSHHYAVNRRLVRATAAFVNQDGAEVLQARFAGFPANMRLAR